jgi:hypothetical protein
MWVTWRIMQVYAPPQEHLVNHQTSLNRLVPRTGKSGIDIRGSHVESTLKSDIVVVM